MAISFSFNPIMLPDCVADAIEYVLETSAFDEEFLHYYSWMIDWCRRNDRSEAADWIENHKTDYGLALIFGWKRKGDG